MQGWIKIHRRIKEHWTYKEKRVFSKFEAWIDLIMRANHKDTKVLLGNELIELKRGQFITSIRTLCNEWNWSNSKVINFLKLLEKDEMITYKSDTKKTVISVINYSVYHENEEEETTRKHHENETKAKQKHTDKNEKNDKNDKNINKRHKFETCDMRLAELFYQKILENNPGHKKPNLEKWANDIRLMRERDERTEEQIEYLINWTQQHEFWHTNILSPEKLRKQFDKLVLQVKQEKKSKDNVTPITKAKKEKYKYNLGF